MKVTPEMMVKLENCKSAEKIMELAKQEKISLTKEQAQKLFDLLQSEDVTEEKMKNVFGGSANVVGLTDIAGIGGGNNNGGAIYN